MRSTHLAIGEIVRPQGIRGEVKLRPITCDLAALRACRPPISSAATPSRRSA